MISDYSSEIDIRHTVKYVFFKKRLVQEVGKLNKKLVHITEQELLEQMGFPPNWKNITRYRLTS